jgi:phage gpG-like protein
MPFTLTQLVEKLERSAVGIEPMLSAELRIVGESVKKMARDMIGNENEGWPPLKPSTIERKESEGFATPDPLLRTGHLRDSIETETLGLTMVVGSAEKNAAYQEMGTKKMPPRPFLLPSAIKGTEELYEALGETAIVLLTPGKLR